jgi:hypothetical protein
VDGDAVVLPDGRLRMYYGMGAPGSSMSRITSSVTSDGKTWQSEATNLVGTTWGAPDVVVLPDGRLRMYYTPTDPFGLAPGQQPSVRSAISDDGITWTVEQGVRLDPAAYPRLVPAAGIIHRVSHPGVVMLADGTWLMLAAFSYDRGFDPRGFSSSHRTELIVWATSTDGLAFTPRGIAVDSRHKATFDGYASSPDPVIWEDGTVRAYFWSPGPQVPHDQKRYNGILFTTFTGSGWTSPRPVRTSAPFPGAFAAGDGGSDPTSAIFRGRMLLFHGHGGGSHEVLQRSVVTTVTHRLNVVRTAGAGRISSGMALGASSLKGDGSTGLACRGSRCATTVFEGTKMWLAATPGSGYRLVGWKGCNAKRPTDFPVPLPDVRLCWLHMTKDLTVTARFTRTP